MATRSRDRGTGDQTAPTRRGALQGRRTALMLCPLGPCVLALPAERVMAVSEVSAEEGDMLGDGLLDLVAFYGLVLAKKPERRRLLLVNHGEHEFSLLVGAEAQVVEFAGEPNPIPAFLGPTATHACIGGFVPYRNRHAFVLDLAALARRAEERAHE